MTLSDKREPTLPDPAPEIIMAANGVYWRRYSPDALSMVPVSDDNDPVIGPLAVYKLVGYEDHHGELHADAPCNGCGSFDHSSARCPNRRFA
jgi:hypothetical protein